MNEVVLEQRGGAGLITLNRPKALNALSLDMIRALAAALGKWRDDLSIRLVAIRGMGREGPFGAFCAGGDIRFFHQAVLAGDPGLEDFFTEEYRLNHLIHHYPKPYVALLDGVVMGGGMGISQGASLRLVTERTRMAMPETAIGLFPDVGGGYFLSRCPGHIGEYLALTGQVIGGHDAIVAGLADRMLPSEALPRVWEQLAELGLDCLAAPAAATQHPADTPLLLARDRIDQHFGGATVADIMKSLDHDPTDWARETAAVLHQRSPLMLHVVLEQVRRGRALGLADNLRMERGMVHRCFHLRPGAAGETMEGIRAVAIDKDHQPRWNPPSIEAVTPSMVAPFFGSPWAPADHPLRDLA